MKTSSIRRRTFAPLKAVAAAILAIALGGSIPHALSYPPAPNHVIYGLVRDQYGTPFSDSEATIIFQTTNGVQVTGRVVQGLAFGANYRIEIPMDSGLSAGTYSPTAFRPATGFRVYVVTGGATNLPIQMSGSLSQLGQPGKQTRLDLTLGVDANGDGIPDDWEYAFMAALGLSLNLTDLRLNVDYVGDGRTLWQEYLLGTYPFDPGDSFTVKLVDLNGGSATLQFTTMTGRSYTILGSQDLQNWTPLSFTIPAEGTNGPIHAFYSAPDIRTLQVRPLEQSPGAGAHFYKLLLQ